MAEHYEPHEIESLLRSLAMAPLSPESVRRVLEDHRDLLHERAELEGLLRRLLPSWSECRTVLNELAVMIDGAGPSPRPSAGHQRGDER